jgi:hypothetical protein
MITSQQGQVVDEPGHSGDLPEILFLLVGRVKAIAEAAMHLWILALATGCATA